VADAEDCSLLSGEFQTLSRATDALVRVEHSGAGAFLALFEIQLHYILEMPTRLRAYAGLAQETYGLPVYPLLVNILPYSKPIPTRFELEFLGLYARQDYHVINLWEVAAEEILGQSLTSLLPFVPVMAGGQQPQMLTRAQRGIAADEALRRQRRTEDALTALTIFASFNSEWSVIMEHLGSNMEVLLRSPFYRNVWQQSAEEEARSMILRLLARRFGELGAGAKAQIRALPLERAEALAEDLLDFESPDDLAAWLTANETVQ
jgi:predicted transposase YdaD